MFKKLFVFLFLTVSLATRAQQHGLKMSVSEANSDSSIALQSRANWFRKLPHYNFDSTKFYFSKAIEYLNRNKKPDALRLVTVMKDMMDTDAKNYPVDQMDSIAISAEKILLSVPQAQRPKILEYELYSVWSGIRVEKADYKRGLDYLTRAIRLVEKETDPELQARVAKSKADYYVREDRKDNRAIAGKELHASLAYYKSKPVQNVADNLAAIYKAMIIMSDLLPEVDSNYYWSKQLRDVLPHCTNPIFLAWYYAAFGRDVIYYEHFANDTAFRKGKNRLEMGEESIIKAISIINQYRLYDINLYPYCIGILGDVALQQKKYDLAIRYYKECMNKELEINFKANAIGMLHLLSSAYDQKGMLDSALYYEHAYAGQRETYIIDQSKRSLLENELKIDVLQKEKELTAKNAQKNLLMALVAIAALLLVLLMFVLLGLNKNYRNKQKLNSKLELLNADLEQKNSLLDKRNAENELLLKEIHHRVKNNLEIISGLLALQAAEIDHPYAQSVMQASQNRVASMGIIHQKLYQKGNLAGIEMSDYFKNLSENILDTFNASNKIVIKIDMPPIELDVDTAVPIGLIANELLCNSIKYAFPGTRNGCIDIKIETVNKNGEMIFTVADDGIGKEENITAKGTGFGTELVNLLVQQLDGRMKVDNSTGTKVEIQFNYSKAA